MSPMPPILVSGLFRDLGRHLLDLLRALGDDDWGRPTVSSQRNVQDIAAHLLDGSLRRLSMQRDGHRIPGAPGPFNGPGELLAYLDRLNAEWTIAARRLSPRVLIDLLEMADRQLADFFESLDPFGPAPFAVAWAGEDASPAWFDVAREYTEKWHHTQQIFEATGRPSTIAGRGLFHPCLDTFMRALPYTYRDVPAPDGTIVAVEVTGEAGGTWSIVRRGDRWLQAPVPPDGPARATVSLGQAAAWKLATRRRSREEVLARFPDIRLVGDRDLAGHALGMIAVMA